LERAQSWILFLTRRLYTIVVVYKSVLGLRQFYLKPP
jgi:hypothetical protein